MPQQVQITSLFAVCLDCKDLDRMRPFIEEGVSALNAKIPSDLGYEEVYNKCSFGAANLILIFDKITSKNLGFFLLDIEVDSDSTSLDISYAYASKDCPKNALHYGLHKSIEFAIMVKADKLTFESPRKGWDKVAINMGFECEDFSSKVKRFVMDFSNAKS